jgi:hypothetical protein
VSTWRAELRGLIERIPDAETADAVGELARAQAIVALRLQGPPASVGENGLRHFKAEDVAELLEVDVTWVYRNKKRLGAVSLADGGAVRFPEAALQRFLERRRA